MSGIKLPRPNKDLTGRVFNRLHVIKFHAWTDTPNRVSLWRCQCSCGTTIIARGRNLIQGSVQSCGCLHKERTSAANKARRLAEGESAFNSTYKKYKQGADKRGYIFDLDIEYFRDITSKPCVYCGTEPSNKTTRVTQDRVECYTYSGIDRVDNTLGYTKENTVSCCSLCNRMKGVLGVSEFLSAIKRICKHTEGSPIE